jgi:hypothetical protein
LFDEWLPCASIVINMGFMVLPSMQHISSLPSCAQYHSPTSFSLCSFPSR